MTIKTNGEQQRPALRELHRAEQPRRRIRAALPHEGCRLLFIGAGPASSSSTSQISVRDSGRKLRLHGPPADAYDVSLAGHVQGAVAGGRRTSGGSAEGTGWPAIMAAHLCFERRIVKYAIYLTILCKDARCKLVANRKSAASSRSFCNFLSVLLLPLSSVPAVFCTCLLHFPSSLKHIGNPLTGTSSVARLAPSAV